jgi:hypothetical protein
MKMQDAEKDVRQEMALLKCGMCGGDLAVAEGATAGICLYCNGVQSIPRLDTVESYGPQSAADIAYEISKIEKLRAVLKRRSIESQICSLSEELDALTKEKAFKQEPIKWRILACDFKKGQALVIAEDIIAKMSYHQQGGSTTWADCSLRHWLNSDVYPGGSVHSGGFSIGCVYRGVRPALWLSLGRANARNSK